MLFNLSYLCIHLFIRTKTEVMVLKQWVNKNNLRLSQFFWVLKKSVSIAIVVYCGPYLPYFYCSWPETLVRTSYDYYTRVWTNAHYIVCIGVSAPTLKNTTPLFFAKPPVKSANYPSPLFLIIPPIYWFSWSPPHPKNLIFQWTPIILKYYSSLYQFTLIFIIFI